jgi:predicted component of type VI protein secretion system
MMHFALAMNGQLHLQMIDSGQGRPVQEWSFHQPSITLGRAPDQDVAIGDSYVSRRHAVLAWENGAWKLTSLGRNGLIVDGRALEDYWLKDFPLRFRLGPQGPIFVVSLIAAGADEAEHAICDETTIIARSGYLPRLDLSLDEERKQAEVREIVENDFFKELQSKARSLRASRS